MVAAAIRAVRRSWRRRDGGCPPNPRAVGGDGGAPGGGGEELARRVLVFGRDKMANYKAPRHAVVVDALPVNASGKVLKVELRQRFARGEGEIVSQERSG